MSGCCCHHDHKATADSSTDSMPTPCDEDHLSCTDHCFWMTNARIELPAASGMAAPLWTVDAFRWSAAGTTLIAGVQRGEIPPVELVDSLRAEMQVWRL
ncbi:MAG: hypothetical protein R3C59_01600 [Planctomycetaceae bacterium]